jgi:hypothetical protein
MRPFISCCISVVFSACKDTAKLEFSVLKENKQIEAV